MVKNFTTFTKFVIIFSNMDSLM
ncbi:hypothetical protein DBR06_SOUSAS2310103, partial [Sousa chinensis]